MDAKEAVNRPPARVRALSFHLAYGCRSTGVCCSSGWNIAVETPIRLELTRLLAAEKPPLPNGADGFRPMADPPKGCTHALRVDPEKRSCWFLDGDRRCAIHSAFGEAALPSACRHFPRVTVVGPRDVSVSLSHYCPTAAGLLFGPQDGGFEVVDGSGSFRPKPFRGEGASDGYEGLDVRSADPPFLRPGVLLGWDGLATIEERSVAALSRSSSVGEALGVIGLAFEAARDWKPRFGAVPEFIVAVFESVEESPSDALRSLEPEPARDSLAGILSAASAGASDFPLADPLPIAEPQLDLPLRRYLASRLFGAWIAYQGPGLRTLWRYLRTCLSLVETFHAGSVERDPVARLRESIRLADLWLVHYVDPQQLADTLGAFEGRPLLRGQA